MKDEPFQLTNINHFSFMHLGTAIEWEPHHTFTTMRKVFAKLIGTAEFIEKFHRRFK